MVPEASGSHADITVEPIPTPAIAAMAVDRE
jgi:hypothetical protein